MVLLLFFYFAITFQMLENFHRHPEKLLILSAYIIKSKTIIQEIQLFIILDLLQS